MTHRMLSLLEQKKSHQSLQTVSEHDHVDSLAINIKPLFKNEPQNVKISQNHFSERDCPASQNERLLFVLI